MREIPFHLTNFKIKIRSFSCAIEGFKYERAWEIAGKAELDVLVQLKSAISTKHNQNELDHALGFFQKYVYDFPGEFFIQTPFIFKVNVSITITNKDKCLHCGPFFILCSTEFTGID